VSIEELVMVLSTDEQEDLILRLSSARRSIASLGKVHTLSPLSSFPFVSALLSRGL
jgi:hypothetical protein